MLIDRYLLRAIAAPFAVTLGVFMCLLLLIRMADLLNYVIAEGGSAVTLAELLAYLVPQYLTLALPVGLLAGVILGFRRLALDGEWDAMLAGGVSTLRLLRAPGLFAFAVSVLVFLVSGFLQPLALYHYEKLKFELEHGSGGLSVAAGEFKQIGDGLVIRARESRRGGMDLRGVFISIRDKTGSVVVAAARARLEPGKAILEEGRLIRLGGKPETASFRTYEIPIIMPQGPAFRGRGNHERELLVPELLRGDNRVEEKAASAGLARRAAQTVSVLLLPLVGMGLARPPSRKKGGEGLFIGLSLYLVYNELSLFGERLGFSGQAPSIAVQAALFLLFAGVAVALFTRVAVAVRWRLSLPIPSLG
jgi:lipopolysaccharide export system permease protein